MKNLLKFFAYPFVIVLSVSINAVLISFSAVPAVLFMDTISLIFYLFLGGIIINKINDKKIKIYSLIFTTIVMLAIGIILAIQMHSGSDTAVWISMIISPFSVSAAGIFENYYLKAVYLIAFVIGTVLPVLISYLASLVFGIEKKKLRFILTAVMILLCIGSAVRSAVGLVGIADESIYQDGEFYNAYYDINGNKYASAEEVPYYDRNGNVYYYTYNHPVDEYSEEWLFYVGEMTDENGKEYGIDDFYVYADGYIFMDKDNTVELRDDLADDVVTDWMYADSEGNTCARFIGVRYTNNGEPYFGMGDEYKNK